jgi:hypothetical protein
MDLDDAMVDGTTDVDKHGSLWVFLSWSRNAHAHHTHTFCAHTGPLLPHTHQPSSPQLRWRHVSYAERLKDLFERKAAPLRYVALAVMYAARFANGLNKGKTKMETCSHLEALKTDTGAHPFDALSLVSLCVRSVTPLTPIIWFGLTPFKFHNPYDMYTEKAYARPLVAAGALQRHCGTRLKMFCHW